MKFLHNIRDKELRYSEVQNIIRAALMQRLCWTQLYHVSEHRSRGRSWHAWSRRRKNDRSSSTSISVQPTVTTHAGRPNDWQRLHQPATETPHQHRHNPASMPFLCRSSLLCLYALLLLFFFSLFLFAAIIYLQSAAAVNDSCQPQQPVIDLTLPLWQTPFDFVDYEVLGHRYSEHACCKNET